MYDNLKNQGYGWNLEKVYHVNCEMGQNLRTKPKKRLPTRYPKPLKQPEMANFS